MTTDLVIPTAPQQPEKKDIQSSFVIAKRFPRDEIEALARIKRACARIGLAQVAIYKFPRGGQSVTGPSIRLAEAIAQNWGNIDCGIKELEHTDGESVLEAWCHDLETNYRKVITWTVKHAVGTKSGLKTLTDPRDIYEKIANDASRRLRACMLAVIPTDVVEEAVMACKKTLETGGKDKPLADRIRDMVALFAEVGVTKQMLEAKLEHTVEEMNAGELADLRATYLSLRDGVAKREDYGFVFEQTDKKINELLGV